MTRTKSSNTGFVEVFLNGLCSGTVSIFVALAAAQGVNLLVQLIWRLVFALPLIFAAVVVMEGVRSLEIQRRAIPMFVGGGCMLILLFLTYMGPIVLGTPIVIVVFFSSTSAIWVVVLGRIILGEEITKKKLLSLFGIMAGVILLSAPWSTHLTFSAGEIAALANGFLYATYLIMTRKQTAGQRPLVLTMGFFTVAVLLLALVVPLLAIYGGFSSVNLRLDKWQPLLGLALVGTASPYILLNTGLEHIQASVAGLICLVTPVVATGLSVIVLGQALAQNQLVGGAIMLLSIANLYR